MALGTAWSAVRHREPAGRRYEHRDGGGYPLGARWLYAARRRFDQHRQSGALPQSQFQFYSRYCNGRRPEPLAVGTRGASRGSG